MTKHSKNEMFCYMQFYCDKPNKTRYEYFYSPANNRLLAKAKYRLQLSLVKKGQK